MGPLTRAIFFLIVVLCPNFFDHWHSDRIISYQPSWNLKASKGLFSYLSLQEIQQAVFFPPVVEPRTPFLQRFAWLLVNLRTICFQQALLLIVATFRLVTNLLMLRMSAAEVSYVFLFEMYYWLCLVSCLHFSSGFLKLLLATSHASNIKSRK